MAEIALINDAVRLNQQGRLGEAADVDRRLLQCDPNNASALHLLGLIRLQEGDHERAIELIGRAVALDPQNALYLANYGVPLQSLGRFTEALDAFGSALEIQPQFAQGLANLGMAQQSLGQHDAAIASYREALKLEHYHADALIKLAMLLEKLGRGEEAIQLYEDGIRHAPCLEFFVNLGALLISAVQPDLALGTLQEAIRLAPNCATAHLNLGMAYTALGHDAEAPACHRKALELKPRNPEAINRLAALLDKLAQAVSGNPPDVPHVYTAAGLYAITATASNGTTYYTTINADTSEDAGTYDSSFPANSAALSDAGFDALATLPTGQIIAVGTGSGSGLIALFNSDGSADSSVSFASSGMSAIRAVAVQPDGSGYAIIAAGTDTSTNDFGLVRYTLSGSTWEVDSTFAGNFATPFSGNFRPDQLAVEPDGSIVVGGYSYTTTTSTADLGVARFLADGAPDTSFGAGGGATTNGLFSAFGDDPCGMTIDAQGNIVLAGTANIPGVSDGYEFALARFSSGGILDSTFGNGGTVLYDLGDQTNHATSVAIQSDGGILVGGFDDGGNWDLVRFLSDGAVDTSFGSEGQVALASGVVFSVAVQPNNQILVGGTFQSGSDFDPGVVRLNVDGSLDGSFGTDGLAIFGSTNGALADIAVQPDGSVLAAGYVGNSYEFYSSSNDPLLAHLYAGDVAGAEVSVTSASPALPVSGDSSVAAGTPYTLTLGDGETSLGYGSGVSYVIDWGDGSPNTSVSADALAAEGDAVTHTFNATTTGISVDLEVAGDSGSPFTDVGSLAVSVNMTDATSTTLSVSSSTPSFGQSVILTAIVTPADTVTGVPSGTVEFYDGTIDLGPGTLALDGTSDEATLTTPPLLLGDHAFTAVYSGDGTFNQSNSDVETVSVTSGMAGTVALSGLGTATAGEEYTLTLPSTAGGDTITNWSINWGDGTTDALDSDMSSDSHVYQTAGDYLIQAVATSLAGNFSAMLDNDVAPAADGTFGTDGTVSGVAGSIASLAVQPDGSIIALDSGASGGPLVRVTAGGQFDGTVFDDVSYAIPTVTAVAVQPVAGGFDILAAGSGYSVARFNSDGSLDTSFGGDGIASIGSWSDAPSIMFVQPDGDIVLAGIEPDSGGGGADDLVLARFTPDGLPDDTFGTDGIEAYDFSAAAASCDAVAQPGGYIVAAVGLSSGSTEVLRFTSAGYLDTSFGSSGTIVVSAVVSDPLVAVQPGGQIDVAGSNGSGDFALLQYPANGGAAQWTDADAGSGSPGALAVQPGGRIVVAVDAVMGSTNSWSLSGFSNAGAADTAFDGLGTISGLTGSAVALAIQPNGDILLAGQGSADAFFARYGAGGPAVTASQLDAAPTGLALTFDGAAITGPIAYSGADTMDGGGVPGVEVEGSFTDPGSIQEAHVVTIEWGDGSMPATIDLAAGETTFSYPLPQYAVSGSYTIDVSVADADGTEATSPVSVTVNYTSTQPAGLSLTLDNSTIYAVGTVNLSGSFTAPQSNLAHLVTINWGDGTSLSVPANSTTFQGASHTYAASGDYTISATVAGLDGVTTETTEVTVNPVLPEVMVGTDIPSASENRGTAGEFLISRTDTSGGDLTVYYTISGTATNGTDYVTVGGSVVITGSDTSAVVDITPIDLGIFGGSKTVVLTLTTGSGYTVASVFSSATVTIWDDDGADTTGTVVASMTAYNSDGTVSASGGQAILGDFIPIGVSITGDTSDKTFTWQYDSSEFIVTSDINGDDVLSPGTPITPTAAYTIAFVWAKYPGAGVAVTGNVSVGETDSGSSGTTTLSPTPMDFEPLQLLRNGVDINNGSPTSTNTAVAAECNVTVGEMINLQIRIVSGTRGLVIWSLPSVEVVKNFQPIGSNGQPASACKPVPLSGDDLYSTIASGKASLSPSLSFAWVEGGFDRVESANVFTSPDGLGSHYVEAMFNVQAPSANIPAATASVNNVNGPLGMNGVNLVQGPAANGASTKDALFGAPGIPGIRFETNPESWNSLFTAGWCQVVESQRAIFAHEIIVADTPFLAPDHDQVYYKNALDVAFPYNHPQVTGFVADDSPGLSDLDKYNPQGLDQTITIIDTFKTWLMAKPDDVPGIWVPVDDLQWQLTFTVKLGVAGWSVTRADPPSDLTFQSATGCLNEYMSWSNVKPN